MREEALETALAELLYDVFRAGVCAEFGQGPTVDEDYSVGDWMAHDRAHRHERGAPRLAECRAVARAFLRDVRHTNARERRLAHYTVRWMEGNVPCHHTELTRNYARHVIACLRERNRKHRAAKTGPLAQNVRLYRVYHKPKRVAMSATGDAP